MADLGLLAPKCDDGPIESVRVFVHHASMEPIGTYDAQTSLATLIRRAAMGEDVVIRKHSVPIVRLLPVAPPVVQRLGIDEGKYTVPDNFNDPITKDGLDVFGL